MPLVTLKLSELYENYKNWVNRNPQRTSDCENVAKIISYLLVGKFKNSQVLSELVYCLSNLLTLFNDRIINKARQLEVPTSGDTLKLWLSVVDYCEVFAELTARKFWGNTGKWIIVVAIQTFKCFSRLLLIYNHKEYIIQNPPIASLNRGNLTKINGVKEDFRQLQLDSFTLKGSGRIIRKVEASPPLEYRDWKPPQKQFQCDNDQNINQSLGGRHLIAETIYVVKPLTHLGLIVLFGGKAWKPWLGSLLMDIISLRLYKSSDKTKINSLTPQQRLHLSRRTVSLILYLIRSPFYEKYSKNKIDTFLRSLSNNIPLARLICEPLAHYLPYWQSQYFYMWSC